MKQTNLSLFVIILLATSLGSCGGGESTSKKEDAATTATPADEGGSLADPAAKPADLAKKTSGLSEVVRPEKLKSVADLTGYYVGMFGPNKINLIVTEINDTKIKGHTVVSGNDRPFEGTVTAEDVVYDIKAAEPGTDTYDGKFDFRISAKAGYDTITLKGNWVANNKKYGKKAFVLKKTNFAYNAHNGMYSQSSTKKLTEADVENFTKHDITIMRNEIYARHGYCFKNKEMRAYFDQESWYMPMNIDIRDQLSPTEKSNDELLKRYEKYAQDYYDDYGR